MMSKKSKEQQDDQYIDLPEGRLDQIEKEEPEGKKEGKARRKPATPRTTKHTRSSNKASGKDSDENNQQSDQYVDLPEDRLGQIYKEEPQDKTEKKARRKPSTSRKTKREQTLIDTPAKVPDEPKLSKEDLLADIRKTLASEEDVVEEKGFFGRLKDRLKNVSKAKTEETETQRELEDGTEIHEDMRELAIKPSPKKKRLSSIEKEEKAVQDFFVDLEALADVIPDEGIPAKVEVQESHPEGETSDLKEKLPKLPVRSDVKEDVDFEKVREVALQEYDDTQVEPAVGRKASLQEEVRETIRESKPLERILLVGVFVLTVGVLLFAGVFVLVKSIPFPTPEPTVVVNLEDQIYPTRLSLPGGWEFNLGQGSVNEGEWSPQGAEWLVGTEISRWVALPWSLQLEAVLRTLKSDDQIELIMSNYDSLLFTVHSIQEMTMEEIQALDIKTPSLIVILFDQEDGANTYWVVTALP